MGGLLLSARRPTNRGATMADKLPNPISRELSVAFWGAIGLYRDWCRGQLEPDATLNREQISISLLCDLVQRFEDPMPDHIWRLLTATSFEELEDRSYRSGALCLARLIRERR